MLAFYREKVKAAVEAKRPLTRSVVDEKIATTRQQLEDAVKRKAFVDCGPLQDKLDGLIALQSQLPTVDELKKSILDAEAAMSLAAQNRNFSGAAAAQKTLDDCRNKLAEALEGEEEVNSDGDEAIQDQGKSTCGYNSRAELESDIAALSLKLEKAVDSKNFAQASNLQAKIDEKQSLRKYLPR
jgi:hypothetical protein